MVAFTGFSNDGYNTLANSLSGLGNTLGNAYLKNQERELERQRLSDLGLKIQSGDLANAANSAFQFGDMATGVSLLKLKQDQDKQKAVLEADRNALSPFNTGTNNANVPMDLAGAIRQQESGNNPNVGTSVDGARGIGQILPDTFNRFAKPGENINNPTDNLNVSNRILSTYMQKYNDPARAAVAYFSGEGNVAPPGSQTPWKNDTHDGNNKYVSQYVNDVIGRMNGGQRPVQVADASGAIPQSANVDGLMKRREGIMRALSSQGISDNARQQLKTMLDDTTFQIQRVDQQSQQPGARLGQEVKQRLEIGRQQGLQGDALQSYALTGKLPKEDQALTAGDRDAIRTADENILASNNVIGALTQAKELSRKALGFPGAGVAAKAGALIGNETAIATTELDNMISGQALDSLRAVFGGNPTEGERKILLDIQGSSSQPDAVRQRIFDRAISAAQKRLQFNKDRADELRGGTYYKPQDQKSVSGDVKSAKPIPSNVLDEARAAIPRKGREAVINLLRQQGFDTSGL